MYLSPIFINPCLNLFSAHQLCRDGLNITIKMHRKWKIKSSEDSEEKSAQCPRINSSWIKSGQVVLRFTESRPWIGWSGEDARRICGIHRLAWAPCSTLGTSCSRPPQGRGLCSRLPEAALGRLLKNKELGKTRRRTLRSCSWSCHLRHRRSSSRPLLLGPPLSSCLCSSLYSRSLLSEHNRLDNVP